MMNPGRYSWGYRGIAYFTQEGCGVVKMVSNSGQQNSALYII